MQGKGVGERREVGRGEEGEVEEQTQMAKVSNDRKKGDGRL